MSKRRIDLQHIFLSYARKDGWEMRAIYNELCLSGFRVWIDDQLEPGAPSWQHEINKMLDGATCVVCICTPNAFSSKWVNIELQLAEQKHLRTYPVLVRGKPEKAIPLSLTSVQFTDCRTEYTASIRKLIAEMMRRHSQAIIADMRTIFAEDGLNWTRFGSLFWFASEIRKLRLFTLPESASHDRVKKSVEQLLHHARRLNADKFTIRDIEDVLNLVDTTEIVALEVEERKSIENKLRLIQDKVAGQAEKADVSFQDGPSPGNPITISND